jgi:signal transduction histidine kinase
MMEPVLRCINLSKSFGYLPVLRQISFEVAPGEVLGLAAGHGGGKSVLASILAGVEVPSEGDVYISGKRMRWPFRARPAGVEVIHQKPELVGTLDVTANIFLGDEVGWHGRGGMKVLDEGRMDKQAAQVLGQLDAHLDSLHELVTNLSSEQRHLVAIARALIHPARLVIVDEPALPLSHAYQQKLLSVIRNWQREGTAVLFISNNLDHFFEVADRIVVLRQGRCVADLPTGTTDREEVVAALVGTTDREQLTPFIWALDNYYRAREQAERLGHRQTLLEQNLATQVSALDSANLALQDAHRRLLTEREEERKALAREIHDEVIQDLLSLNYELEEIELEAEAPSHEEKLVDELAEVRATIRSLVDDLRRICSNLRPPTIDSLGLGAAIQSFTRDWSTRAGVRVTLDLDDQLGRLPEALELSIFRIVQEGLSNVRKHAGAEAVEVGLRRTAPGTLIISIADDGRGLPRDFDLATLAEGGHFGVLGISERLALVEGRLHIQNRPGGGALLKAEIPVPRVGIRAERVGADRVSQRTARRAKEHSL